MRGFESRLRRLEGGGACPHCQESKDALIGRILGQEPANDPEHCPGRGKPVKLTIAEVDAILAAAELEGEG